jgi:hypothetical protein
MGGLLLEDLECGGECHVMAGQSHQVLFFIDISFLQLHYHAISLPELLLEPPDLLLLLAFVMCVCGVPAGIGPVDSCAPLLDAIEFPDPLPPEPLNLAHRPVRVLLVVRGFVLLVGGLLVGLQLAHIRTRELVMGHQAPARRLRGQPRLAYRLGATSERVWVLPELRTVTLCVQHQTLVSNKPYVKTAASVSSFVGGLLLLLRLRLAPLPFGLLPNGLAHDRYHIGLDDLHRPEHGFAFFGLGAALIRHRQEVGGREVTQIHVEVFAELVMDG